MARSRKSPVYIAAHRWRVSGARTSNRSVALMEKPAAAATERNSLAGADLEELSVRSPWPQPRAGEPRRADAPTPRSAFAIRRCRGSPHCAFARRSVPGSTNCVTADPHCGHSQTAPSEPIPPAQLPRRTGRAWRRNTPLVVTGFVGWRHTWLPFSARQRRVRSAAPRARGRCGENAPQPESCSIRTTAAAMSASFSPTNSRSSARASSPSRPAWRANPPERHEPRSDSSTLTFMPAAEWSAGYTIQLSRR